MSPLPPLKFQYFVQGLTTRTSLLSFFAFSEKEARTPGHIEDLCDLLAEDWASMGSVREMGIDTARFFRQEMERTLGSKHLAVFDEEEAKNYVLGVSTFFVYGLVVDARGSSFMNNLEVELVISSNPSVIYFQSIRLLRVSADLEAKANLLRKEALQSLTIALAGSDTKSFWDLLAAYFGANHSGNEDDDPWDFLDAAPTISPPLPLTETESEGEKASVKSAPVDPTAKVKVPRKPKVSQQKDLLDDLCGVKEAIRMYPCCR